MPKRLDDGNAAPEYPSTAKDMYRQSYYEALDLAVNSISQRFNQPGFRVYSNLEQFLFKACTGDNYHHSWYRTNLYSDDHKRVIIIIIALKANL